MLNILMNNNIYKNNCIIFLIMGKQNIIIFHFNIKEF